MLVDRVENVAKFKVNGIHCSHPPTKTILLPKKSDQARSLLWLILGDPALIIHNCLFLLHVFRNIMQENLFHRFLVFFPGIEVWLDSLQLLGLLFEFFLSVSATFLQSVGISMAPQRWLKVTLHWHQTAVSVSLDTALVFPWTCTRQVFSSNF